MEEFNYELYLKEQEEYLEKNSYLFVFTNPHPEGLRVGDCVKRALTLALGKDYKDISLELNRFKKLSKAKKFNEDKNWQKYLSSIKMNVEKISGWNNVKVAEFAKNNPNGTFIARIRKHVVCIKDGKILDTWNCGFKAIGKIWKVN